MPREQFNKYRRHQRSRSSVCSSSESSFIWPRVGLVLLPWMICLGTFKTADNISISHWSLLSIIVSQIFIPRPRSDHWLWPIQAGEASSCLVGPGNSCGGKASQTHLYTLHLIAPCDYIHTAPSTFLHMKKYLNRLAATKEEFFTSEKMRSSHSDIYIFLQLSRQKTEKLALFLSPYRCWYDEMILRDILQPERRETAILIDFPVEEEVININHQSFHR